MKKNMTILLVSLLAFGSLIGLINITTENTEAGTPKSGIISTDETWTLAGSPYWIEGDVTILNGVTLTIYPGVEIRFYGYYSLFVHGNLIAIGTVNNEIYITSNSTTPSPSNWDKIRVSPSGHVDIEYCRITFGNTGIFLESNSYNTIMNNNISNNIYGIHLLSSSNNILINNNVSNNINGMLFSHSSNNTIEGNNISNNLHGLGLVSSSNNTIKNNNFFNDGIVIFGDNLSHYNSHTIPNSNVVNGKPFHYYKNCNDIDINTITIGQLMITNCTNVDIRNLVINNTDVGIEVAYSTNINITNNKLSSNKGGILLASSSNSNIVNNDVNYNIDGISFRPSSNSTIIDNKISFNTGNGLYIDQSSNNNIKNNVISNNYRSINFRHSYHNTITNNYLSSNNEDGICFYFSSNNIITNNNISLNTEIGILLSSSSKNNFTNNHILSNGAGIHLQASLNNILAFNEISNNGYGISLYLIPVPSSYNRIHHNNIINNSNQVRDDASNNFWNETYPSGGNYWGDYSPTCLDNFNGSTTPQTGGSSDGICDNQYNIDIDSIDYYPLKNPIDTTPPIIANIQPSDESITNNSNPMISGNYSDPSGINISSVLLQLDGSDVTPLAIITATGVAYIPTGTLSDGIHSIYLEVEDSIGNLAVAEWSFAVVTFPTISNLKPPDSSITNDNTPIISANYSDPSGIDLNCVLLKIDGLDVTSLAIITSSGIEYIPGTALLDDIHNVYLEVQDNAGNLSVAMWSFTVDSTPPVITNLQPQDISLINDNTPIISVNYSDSSGIDLNSVMLRIDGLDATSLATVTSSGLTYTPISILLADGNHTIYVEVKDNVGNLATITWSFAVDATPPIANADGDQTILVGHIVTFNGTASTDNIGISNYTWKITKNGQLIMTLYDAISSYKFEEIGSYEVILTVKDNAGNLDTDSITITVNQLPKPCDFLSDYWWILIFIIIVVSIIVTLFIWRRRKGKGSIDESPSSKPPDSEDIK